MKIEVKRYLLEKDFTVGNLYIDGKHICETMEDRDRNLTDTKTEEENMKMKVYGKTAIPIGTYKLTIDYSNKYKKMLPHILDVKAFDGIRIHSLNFASESLGCIGVGTYDESNPGMITKSRYAMGIIKPIIQKAIDAGERVTIDVFYEETVIDKRND